MRLAMNRMAELSKNSMKAGKQADHVRSRARTILIVAFLVVACGFVLLAAGAAYLLSGLDEGQSLQARGIDGASISDGRYIGSYGSGRWQNELAVTVVKGKIQQIELLRPVRFERSEITEELFQRIMSAQDTKIDVVSGATVTCNVYIQSIEEALKTDVD